MSLSKGALAQSAAERIAPLKILSGDDDALLVHEVYRSLQGEGTRAGRPCTFVRLTGCHLRCQYCDTEHAFDTGTPRRVDEVVADVGALGATMVQLTGGEPLLQRGARPLIERLSAAGHEVVVETSGAVSIEGFDSRAHFVVDVKTPASGEAERNRWENVAHLKPGDELKFVLCSRDDYEWAKAVLVERRLSPASRGGVLPEEVAVLFSPAAPDLSPTVLADWIIDERLDVRFQLQLHKVLWGEQRGV